MVYIWNILPKRSTCWGLGPQVMLLMWDSRNFRMCYLITSSRSLGQVPVSCPWHLPVSLPFFVHEQLYSITHPEGPHQFMGWSNLRRNEPFETMCQNNSFLHKLFMPGILTQQQNIWLKQEAVSLLHVYQISFTQPVMLWTKLHRKLVVTTNIVKSWLS